LGAGRVVFKKISSGEIEGCYSIITRLAIWYTIIRSQDFGVVQKFTESLEQIIGLELVDIGLEIQTEAAKRIVLGNLSLPDCFSLATSRA